MIELLIKLGVVVGMGIIGVLSYKIWHMPADNHIEEAAEEIIKKHTKVDIDLSPKSPEKEKKR